MVSLGFIGFGEAAYYMSLGLAGEGVTGICAYDVAFGSGSGYERGVRARAEEAGVVCKDSLADLAKGLTFMALAVPSAYTEKAALDALAHIAAPTVFVDLTAAGPLLKERVAKEYAAKGIAYVDAAMLGPLPGYRHKVPMYCSGEGTEQWISAMKPYGMQAELLEGGAGMASKVKIVRSAFMKGLEALCVETFLLARKLDLEKRIMSNITDSLSKEPVEGFLIRMMLTNAVHSERRAHEAVEAKVLMEELGIVPAITKGTIERMNRTTGLGLRAELNGQPPKDMAALYSLWESKNYT